ncbi:hypothetical protein [uncultured Sphingomonas sp.]|uniref:hypothetical protein n=1 Tax=uncultured Sphingomonas sp. TaxID=158754 RepID=UPI0035CC0AAD
MPRPDPRTIALENAAFLRALRKSGNVDAAAAAIGRDPTTMRRRRARAPAFAAEWRAAAVVAAAWLQAKLNGRRPGAWEDAPAGVRRTAGGEPIIARGRGGLLQQRAAHPNRLTRHGEQAFLLALSVTANVGLAAAAAGAPKYAFYRRRHADPAFAREWRLALAEGYAQLELRCLAAADPESHGHDAWRHNEAPEPPPMTVSQMLQLMYLHQKEARLLAEPAHLKRRRGESREAQSYRLAVMHELRLERDREAFRVAEAARATAAPPEAERITLPDLAQVTAGRAPPKVPHDPGRALFGGWRIEEMEQQRAAAARKRKDQRRG